MITLDELNMSYVTEETHQFSGGVAVIPCDRGWTVEEISNWVPDLEIDALHSVKNWLSSEPYIAEGMNLKVWVD